ncbi:MAG: hypothetical protein JWO03_3938 [Bacteroidetes bacterium]|nr:hypothetical protein [Bacteroidota bacterium]
MASSVIATVNLPGYTDQKIIFAARAENESYTYLAPKEAETIESILKGYPDHFSKVYVDHDREDDEIVGIEPSSALADEKRLGRKLYLPIQEVLEVLSPSDKSFFDKSDKAFEGFDYPYLVEKL